MKNVGMDEIWMENVGKDESWMEYVEMDVKICINFRSHIRCNNWCS